MVLVIIFIAAFLVAVGIFRYASELVRKDCGNDCGCGKIKPLKRKAFIPGRLVKRYFR